jgi:hypothetical protein
MPPWRSRSGGRGGPVRGRRGGAAGSSDSENNASFDEDEKGILGGGLPRVHATRDGNRISVRTRGVKRVTLLASDQMLDLKKEVTVSVNDRVLFRGKVAPDARAIPEEARRFKDRALVFSTRISLDVDAAAVPDEAPAPDGN